MQSVFDLFVRYSVSIAIRVIMNCQLVATFLLLGCGLFELSVEGRTSEELLVTLPNGSKLAGRGLQSHDGRAIKAFMGIPYAQPPLGDLRFKVNDLTLILISLWWDR